MDVFHLDITTTTTIDFLFHYDHINLSGMSNISQQSKSLLVTVRVCDHHHCFVEHEVYGSYFQHNHAAETSSHYKNRKCRNIHEVR